MSTRQRLENIDLLRGVVMALMALDHARDYFGDITRAPEDLETTTLPLFLTRWVTHFCAPVFVFLAGTSAFLYGSSGGRTRGALSRFLAVRGLWLVLLEFTVVKFGWVHSIGFPAWIFQVIAVLGASMVVLAGLVWLPRGALLALGAAILLGHDALTGTGPQEPGAARAWWAVGFEGFAFFPMAEFGSAVADAGLAMVIYPVVPWLGIMLLGYAAGPLFRAEAGARRRALLGLGAAATATFVLLRLLGGYGDPTPFASQDTAARTLIAFLNCAKYPPSLQYTLMTMGPALLFLGLVERAPGAVGRTLVSLGRVPLLFYVTHLPLLSLAGAAVYWIELDVFLNPMTLQLQGQQLPEGYGHGLDYVYVGWALCLAALAWPCLAFARLKARSSAAWLSYL